MSRPSTKTRWLGPDAVETYLKEDYTTNAESIAYVFERQSVTDPALSMRDAITYFSGVRAATYEEDFVIRPGKWTKNLVHAAGIQSPGTDGVARHRAGREPAWLWRFSPVSAR